MKLSKKYVKYILVFQTKNLTTLYVSKNFEIETTSNEKISQLLFVNYLSRYLPVDEIKVIFGIGLIHTFAVGIQVSRFFCTNKFSIVGFECH